MDDKARASSTIQWHTLRFLRLSECPVPPANPADKDFFKGGNTLYTRLLPLLVIAPPPAPRTDLLKGGNTPYTRLLPLFFIDLPRDFPQDNHIRCLRQNTPEGRLRPLIYINPPTDSPFDATAYNARTPILVRQKRPDTLLTPSFLASLLIHALILAIFFYKAAKSPRIGTPQATSQPVEVIFSQPESSHGMVGRPSRETGSGNHARRSEQANALPPTSAETAPSPTHKEETPSITALPPSNNGLPHSEEQSTTLQHPHKRTGHQKPHPSRHKPLRPWQRPNHHTPSPFDHITDLSFNEAPAPRRRSLRRPGGSGAPINFSIGPLVQNGQLNVRYASRTMVKGVSNDYAAEIDAWIRRHLFYPPEAAARGEEGGSSVHVILDRSGMVLKVFETNSSGYVELDAATVGIFQGAQLPPVPPDMKDRFINFDVTVNYILIRR